MMDGDYDKICFTHSGKRVLEQTIRQEVNALVHVLMDLYLGQIQL